MTYETVFHVISGIEVFQLTYGYFETNFEIVDNTRGQIGSGEVRSTRLSATNSTSTSLRTDDISPEFSTPSPLPNAPFLRHIRSDPPLDLNFTAFGQNISEADVLACYATAAIYLKQRIESHGDAPIPVTTPLHWAYGTASLTIQHQPSMTWSTLSAVLADLSLLQRSHPTTETTFSILLPGAPRPAGSGTLSRTQPSSPSSPLTAPTPHDPTTARVRDTPITLTFSAYGRALPAEDFLLAISQLTFRIISELLKPDGKDSSIGDEVELQWRWGRALVFVVPEREMTWGVLGTAVEGVTAFGTRFGWVSCDFEVGADGVGAVGRGFVGYL
ncbi:MAG: hypothetical protein HETSPECPRED_007707 [Heterodermia speciosa]|uniref:Uncharacterized protein n=1 Tax=Heterodermia speciosa TaxID=116794 RepID=A0A8H3IW89_9LECA|nr:MAG: hypothetical protein HETSPECPRED_007707 [Heterodermia speciosa]